MNKGKTTHNEKKGEKEVKGSSEFGKNDDIKKEEKEIKEDTAAIGSSEISTSFDEPNKIVQKEDNMPSGEKKAEDITGSSDNEDDDAENKGKIEKDENEDLSADGETIEEKSADDEKFDVAKPADAESLPTGQAGSGVAKEEFVGEATFKKGTNSKKSLAFIVIVIVIATLVLFARTNEGKDILATLGFDSESAVSEKYVNPIYKYAFEFESDENSKLVVAGNIPAELGLKGVKSMQDLNLTNGDALLIRTDAASGDNIVYTVLELSKRGEYVAFNEYLEALRINLDNTTQSAGTEYIEKESIAGKEKLPAIEFSFEMDVLTDQENMETRVGVFYDTVFETDDNAYSISFGYPKDIVNAKYYIDSYYDLVASFTYGEEIDEETDEKIDSVPDDSEGTETETVPEDGKIEVVE